MMAGNVMISGSRSAHWESLRWLYKVEDSYRTVLDVGGISPHGNLNSMSGRKI